MSRGEELIRKYTDAMHHEFTYSNFRREHPDKVQAFVATQMARVELRDYVAGMEDVLESVAQSIDVAIAGLETYNPIIVEEDEGMCCGDFTPRDFNMIEEHNTIIDDTNKEGFEIFNEDKRI